MTLQHLTIHIHIYTRTQFNILQKKFYLKTLFQLQYYSNIIPCVTIYLYIYISNLVG